MGIKRMTKNPNPGFFLFCEERAEGGGRGCRAEQGWARGTVGKGGRRSNYFHM